MNMENDRPRAAVVIIAYNDETHIDRAIQSVCNQTERNIEIICVDDGSTDSTCEHMRRCANRDARIRVISQPNSGALGARYAGLRHVTSDYVLYLDSDDVFMPEAVEIACAAADEIGADVLEFGVSLVIDESNPPTQETWTFLERYFSQGKPLPKKDHGPELVKACFTEQGAITWNIWNKLYQTELLQKAYQFYQGEWVCLVEDTLLTLMVLCQAERYARIPAKLHAYTIGGGISTTKEALTSESELKQAAAVGLTIKLAREWMNKLGCTQGEAVSGLEALTDFLRAGILDHILFCVAAEKRSAYLSLLSQNCEKNEYYALISEAISRQQGNIERLEESMRQLEEQNRCISKTAEAQQARIAQLEEQNRCVNETAKTQQARITQLEEQNRCINETKETQQAYITQLEEQNRSINETKETQQAYITQLEEQNRCINETKETQQAYITQLEEQNRYYSESFDIISNAFFWKITKPARLLTDFTKKELSAFLYLPYVKEAAKGMDTVFLRCFPKLYSKYLAGFKQKLKKDPIAICIENSIDTGDDSNWTGEARRPYSTPPLVSIIVPNYNHAPFLRERLDSVYGQTYTNYEVILLDDCSTDDSRLILEEYARKHSNNTTVIFNNHNSGKVFTQWNKGISQAKGSLIWIAESDDWCEPNFLESLVPWFEYESVMLAFSRSVFMQDGAQSWTQEEYLADLPGLDFSRPFVMTAHLAVNKGFGVKNIIPNVSSAVLRNTGEIPDEITRIWQELQLCGDWLFYLHIIRGGTIAYTNETTNYYRVHQDSTSLKIQKTAQYYIEQETISKYVASHYKVPLSIFEQVQRILEEHCKAIQKTTDLSMVHENYHIQAIKEAAKSRKPNVLMCGFALQIGGGETYPIILANEMRRQGVPVTYVNFNMKYKMEPYSKEIRDRLSRDIPLITLEKLWPISGLFVQLGAEVIHSHHGSVDNLVSRCLETMENTDCKQIVTLHGMYETMDDENCRQSLAQLNKTCKQVIYIADKNYQCFERFGYQNKFKMTKLGNGLPCMETNPVPRSSLGIEEEAFVLCLASRALREKGWREASEAVIQANKQSDRPIHLVLLGDGEMRPVLEKSKSRFIHVIGQKSNVRDYFAMADMGLLPSCFRGESYPLVLIECMLTGRPVIATEVGEVRHQMEDENGELAGLLLPVHNWTLDKTVLLETILRAANDRDLYETLRQKVPSVVQKFDIETIVKRHLEIYSTL